MDYNQLLHSVFRNSASGSDKVAMISPPISGEDDPQQMVVCYIMDGNNVLLKKNVRGVSEGKWVGVGGKVLSGEDNESAVKREVMEETRLKVGSLQDAGSIMIVNIAQDSTFGSIQATKYMVHYYVTSDFSGTPRSTEEGQVRWFDRKALPYDTMWPNDRHTMPRMLNGSTVLGLFDYGSGSSSIRNGVFTEQNKSGSRFTHTTIENDKVIGSMMGVSKRRLRS